MSELTYNEYWTEIKGIASNLVCEALQSVEIDNNNEPMDFDDKKEQAMDLINDSLLHETIDGHQWVIYYAYNLDVIKIADHVIDLGPDGGVNGGYIIAEGTPEEVAEVKEGFTAKFLKEELDAAKQQ